MGSKSRQQPKGVLLDQKIKNLAGKAMRDLGMPEEGTGKGPTRFADLILRNVLVDSLLRDDTAVDPRTGIVVPAPTEPRTKFNRSRLAEKIYGADKRIEFTSKETEILKDQVGKHHSPMVVNRVWIMLDPAEASKTD